jgi:hypothetical protein
MFSAGTYITISEVIGPAIFHVKRGKYLSFALRSANNPADIPGITAAFVSRRRAKLYGPGIEHSFSMRRKVSAGERALARSKKIPLRSSQIAEEYAEKVRMEPPKPTRQETETLDTSIYHGIPGQLIEPRDIDFESWDLPESAPLRKVA